MTANWPPLDTHAHVDPNIDPTVLVALRAVVFAATRTLDEFEQTLDRSDKITVWGVGVHPGVPDAHSTFEPARFAQAIERSPLVSEVGLDARSTVPTATQRTTFEAVVEQLHQTPRIVSVHSVGATKQVIETIRQQPITGVILHWWRGTPDETAEAVDLGCYFSINAAERTRPAVLGRVPHERILTETDHPHGPNSDCPGDTVAVEALMSKSTDASPRTQVWRNLSSLVADSRAGTALFPARLQSVLAAAAEL